LKKLIKAEDSFKYMEAQRIRWWDHVQRMEDITPVIKITGHNPIGVRTRGRSKNRCRGEVINDLRKWKQKLDLVKDRKAQNDLMQKTKTNVGLIVSRKTRRLLCNDEHLCFMNIVAWKFVLYQYK